MSDQVFQELFATLKSRKRAAPDTSYTAQLLQAGVPRIAKKLGEESTETIIAALQGSKAELKAESADLLYHLFVLWVAAGITPDDVAKILQKRMGLSGLAEKAARKT